MDWINIHTSTLRSPEFLGECPRVRATWLCLLSYSVSQENSGRIEKCASWKSRQWQQICGITLAEVRAESALWSGMTDAERAVLFALEAEGTA